MKYAVRFQFSKTGRAKYISHLDLVRCIQRAVRRSGLPVHYTEGFHPHMETVCIAALPLGMESTAEILEIQLDEPIEPETAREQLQAAMPEGILLLKGYPPVHKVGELGYVRYRLTLEAESGAALLEQWHSFLELPEVLTEKKTKRGIRTIDILPQIECTAETVAEAALTLELCLSVGTPESINPFLLLDCFSSFSTIPFRNCGICRIQLCTQEKSEFF